MPQCKTQLTIISLCQFKSSPCHISAQVQQIWIIFPVQVNTYNYISGPLLDNSDCHIWIPKYKMQYNHIATPQFKTALASVMLTPNIIYKTVMCSLECIPRQLLYIVQCNLTCTFDKPKPDAETATKYFPSDLMSIFHH